MVSGIGCSARIAGYVDFHTMHTLHGRALAFATGIKMSRPDPARHRADGRRRRAGHRGQPFHPRGAAQYQAHRDRHEQPHLRHGPGGAVLRRSPGSGCPRRTAPYGNIDREFDTVRLALGAGATFVARTTTYHMREMISIFKKALQHEGFAVVEVLSQCPTYFGRKNKLGDAVRMMERYRDHTAPVGSPKLAENPTLVPRGIFTDEDQPEYCARYASIIASQHQE